MMAVARGLAMGVLLAGLSLLIGPALIGPALGVQTLGVQAAPLHPLRAASVETLRQQLHGEDLALAVTAAKSLGTKRGRASAEALLEALRLGAPPRLAVALLESISLQPTARSDALTFVLVRHYCGHRNAIIRPVALQTLSKLPHKGVDEVLVGALDDSSAAVRATAASLVGQRKVTRAQSRLLALLVRGDGFAAAPLGQLALAGTATSLAALVGSVPPEALTNAFGEMLGRSDFGPDPLRVRIVEALGRIQGIESTATLVEYVASVPPGEVRRSKRVAEQIISQRD